MGTSDDDDMLHWDPEIGENLTKKEQKKPWYERVSASLKRRLRGLTTGFRNHIFVFTMVNTLLIGLNMTIAAPWFPWFYFPLVGWGIGLLANARAFLNRRREVKQLSLVPGISEKPGKLLRHYQRAIGALAQHATAFVSVNAYLAGINLITSPEFLWFLFPLAAWSIGFVPHVMGNLAKRKMLADDLKEYGIDVRELTGGTILKERAGDGIIAAQAEAVKARLLANLKSNAVVRERWGEIEPLLGTYVAQIGELEKKRAELDRVMTGLSMADLERELNTVRQKNEQSADSLLKREYERSIAQYEGHLKAARDITQHREILDLRLNNAYQLLKKLELDTVRLAHADSLAEPASLASLRGKTEEMQVFLEDFKKGVDELEQEL